MALNTNVQPFISQMLRAPDPKSAEGLVEDVVGGFAGSYVAAKELKEEEARKAAEAAGMPYTPPPKGKTESFLRSYLRGPGVRAVQASPFGPLQQRQYGVSVREAEHVESLNRAVEPKNVINKTLEVGNLPIDQIPNWLEQNKGMLASPATAQIWNRVLQGYNQTRTGQIQAQQSKDLADLAQENPDLDVINNPEDRKEGWKRKNKRQDMESLLKDVTNAGKGIAPFTPDMFDENTGKIKPEEAMKWIEGLPISPRFQTQEENASRRLDEQIRHNRAVENAQKSDPAALVTARAYGQNRVDAAIAGGITDPDELAKIRLDAEAEKLVPSGQQISVETPEGTKVVIGKQGKEVGPSSAVSNVAKKEILAQHKVVTELQDLQKTLRPGDVGIRGVVGNLFFDKVLPQMGYKTADVLRMSNREKLATLREGALRIVTTDSGMFSNRDREFVTKTLPGTDVTESYENAMTVAAELERIMAKRALINALHAGIKPPQFALDALDDVGLQEARDAGLIDRETAKQNWLKRQRP